MAYAAFLFDLDGTLVDSHREISLSLQKAFVDIGMAFPFARVAALVDGSSLESIWERVTPPRGARYDEFAAGYRRHYIEDVGSACDVYPGVSETLTRLRSALPDTPFAVVSNKSAATVQPLLDVLGLAPHFSLAMGCGGTPMAPKPDPEMLLVAAAQLGVEAGHCAMVGDTLFDVEAAVSAGMSAYAVAYGQGDAVALKSAGAIEVVTEFTTLYEPFARGPEGG